VGIGSAAMNVPRHYPLHSEEELRTALKECHEAQMRGAFPTSISAGDFSVSLNSAESLSLVDRKLRHDLYMINPTKYANLLKVTSQSVSFSGMSNL